MDIDNINHRYENIYKKIMYIHDHSGNGATVHETGHFASLLFNYHKLLNKENANRIMGEEMLKHYYDKLEEYISKSEEFIKEIAHGKSSS